MSPETLIGMELGKGVLQRQLGQGTMGTVYLAYQAHAQRQVAVKIFLPASLLEKSEQGEFRQRLHQEIARGGKLEHPHILAILDYGEHQDLAYEVMPYIAGESLQALLNRSGALPFTQIQQYLEQMADALDYAHLQGVLHKDIKPGNVLLAPEGKLLLADFGLASITTEKNFARARQALPGILNYIAPEYVLSQATDQRADLYSLGAVLYHMVTGAPPFKGTSLSATAMMHVKAPPASPCSLRKDLPQAAGQVILRALAKRRDDRYSRAQDLASAFRLALEAEQILPSTEQESSALDALSDLANGGATAKMARVSVSRGGSLFHPKWQTLSTSGGKEEPAIARAIPPTPILSTTTETVASLADQQQSPLFPPTSSPEQLESSWQRESSPPPPSASQGIKRTGLLSFANSQLTTDKQPGNQIPFPQKSVSNSSLKLENPPVENTEELRAAGPGLPQNTTSLLSALSTFSQNGDNTGTIKLTESVKIVQLPVAGQPGRFVTGFLPSLSAEQVAETSTKATGKHLKLIGLVLVLLMIVAGSGIFLWTTHGHSNQAAQLSSTPDASLSATARATATMEANIILSDDLSQNIHDWPVGQKGNFIYTFKNNAYYISNNDARQSASALLPGKVISGSFAYSLNMEQIKGDTTSPNDQFGMILYATIHNTGNTQIDKFYAFEVVNKAGGEYQFWKYDNSKNSTSPWTSLWTKSFGKEFLQGNGSAHANTFKVIADGKMFTFIVNGKQVGTMKDSSFTSGSIGMLVNLNGAQVAFSNLLVTHS